MPQNPLRVLCVFLLTLVGCQNNPLSPEKTINMNGLWSTAPGEAVPIWQFTQTEDSVYALIVSGNSYIHEKTEGEIRGYLQGNLFTFSLTSMIESPSDYPPGSYYHCESKAYGTAIIEQDKIVGAMVFSSSCMPRSDNRTITLFRINE